MIRSRDGLVATHSLHDVLKGVETDIARDVADLSVHGHGDTLTESREDKRPFSADKRQLDRYHSNDSTENTRGIDIDVVQVSLCNGARWGEFVLEENQRQKLTGKIERPVITLQRNS
jgi:hypothetical protein